MPWLLRGGIQSEHPRASKRRVPIAEERSESVSEPDTLRAAAALLLEIAGDAPEHVHMTRGGRAKYYTVFQPLALDVDAALVEHLAPKEVARLRASTTIGHLLGVTTRGALL